MGIDGKTIGVALSGGGFRATLFGLGSLWRLNDAGLLGRVDRITSVSGGSILAGVLAHGWSRLRFTDGTAENFREVVAVPVQRFCSQTIDVGAGLKGLLVPFKTAGEFLADRYAKDLFGKATVKELPDPERGEGPRFVFYATNLQTGRSFRFRQDMVADYVIGLSRTVSVPLATAVAASSAFPPVFSPVVLHTDPAAWEDAAADLPELEALRRRISLADGGIYDNMGLEALVGNVDVILVSDAGAPFDLDVHPHEDDILQMGRVRDILIDQTRALRKRWLVSEFEAGRSRGAHWGIGTKIDEYAAPDALARDGEVTGALASVRTRLNRFSPEEQGRLVNWGYALADAALRARARLPVRAPGTWPEPDWALP